VIHPLWNPITTDIYAMSAFEWIMAIIASPVLIALVVALEFWMLKPLADAYKHGRGKTQYLLADFFCLLVHIQIAVLVAIATNDGKRDALTIYTAVSTWLFLAVMWWMGVTALSRANIRSQLRRAVFLLVVVPIACLGSMWLVLVGFKGVIAVLETDAWGANTQRVLQILWPLLAGLAAMFVIARLANGWVLSGPVTAESAEPEVSFWDVEEDPAGA